MVFELFSNLISLILSVIDQLGYVGIFIGMTIESSFFPFPSEIILIPAGALVAQGKMNFLPVFLAGILGSLAGAIINYFIAFSLGRKAVNSLIKRKGISMFLSQEKLKKSDDYFKSHGEITTFIGRLIPGIRQIISLPAGFSKMNLSKFLLYTFLGAGLWSIILILLGFFFGSNASIIVKNITLLILIIALIIMLLYILFRRRKSSRLI